MEKSSIECFLPLDASVFMANQLIVEFNRQRENNLLPRTDIRPILGQERGRESIAAVTLYMEHL
jgi:hypothetical protein